uniref:GLOBIN domain-containing protein n=1 Tax=Syphacia muris TaxID=451379 RepID=A0A0N5AL91_9BILA
MSDPYSRNAKDHEPSPSSASDIERWQPTHEERELLRMTWSNDFEFLYQLGTNIYTYIFNTNPKAKSLFPFVKLYGNDWKECREFRSQALKFAQTLSLAIKNLYSMDQLVPLVYDIGAKHCKYAHRGFEPKHWDVFLDAMEQALSDHIRSLETLNDAQKLAATAAWRTLSLFIIIHMKRGFQDGLKRKNYS